jgi:N-hydroxyarylamine O-acetyltransferase
MNVETYLKRIGYDGPREPGIETLRALHRCHMLTIPFENLDIPLGRPIVLNVEHLYNKLVVRRRGGYCYELNGLFAWLLAQLGFDVKMISAGVAHETSGFGPEFDHMALVVQLEHQWLADVGFGDSFIEPVLLSESQVSEDPTGIYRVVSAGAHHQLVRLDQPDVWTPLYQFTLAARKLEDYDEQSAFHQTSPESWFTKRRICTLATHTGRVTLSNLNLVIEENRVRRERELASEAEFQAALGEYFQIEEDLTGCSIEEMSD